MPTLPVRPSKCLPFTSFLSHHVHSSRLLLYQQHDSVFQGCFHTLHHPSLAILFNSAYFCSRNIKSEEAIKIT